MIKLNRYQYVLKDNEGTYYGYYTILTDKKPLGLPGEKLIATFNYDTTGHTIVADWKY